MSHHPQNAPRAQSAPPAPRSDRAKRPAEAAATPFVWSYFLRGGGNSDERTRCINAVFGDPREGNAELFNLCRLAVDMGANGIYLQNPGGCDRTTKTPPPMYADQFLKCAKIFGSAWVDDFAANLRAFVKDHPTIPVICYCGGLFGNGFDFTPREQFVAFADTCYAAIVNIPNVHIGYDSSADNAPDSVQDFIIERNEEFGRPGWKEPHCLAHRPHAAWRNCIVTSTEFYKHLKAWGIPAPGARVLRIMDIDPPTNRLQRIAEFMAECAAYGHEPAVPFHLHGLGSTPVGLRALLRDASTKRVTAYRRELILRPK